MKITIYLELTSQKNLWKFHEIEIKKEDWDFMTANNFKGFNIVNPNHTNLMTKPTIVDGFVEIYKVEARSFIYMPWEGDIIIIGKLLDEVK